MVFKIGVCQFQPKLLEKEKNIEKMINMVDGLESDLIVFPELSTSGYLFENINDVVKIADNFAKSDTTMIFRKLSKKNKTAYVVGFPEIEGRNLYNSTMLINPDGSTHLYRKIHLFNEEKKWFKPGNLGFSVVETKHRTLVGQMICFDWIFPESARTLMLKGAQIIVHAANLVLPWCQNAMVTRSIENKVFTITCNRTGSEKNTRSKMIFTGMSQATSPLGEVLFRLSKNEEKVKIVEINCSLANEKNLNTWNNIIEDRRIEFYK